MAMVLRRMKIDGATPHGFRSTFRDWAAERTLFTNEVCEAALAHVISNKAEAAYRRGDLFDKRRKLMEAWAAYCPLPRAPKSSRSARRLCESVRFMPVARGRSANRRRTRHHRRPAFPCLPPCRRWVVARAVAEFVRGLIASLPNLFSDLESGTVTAARKRRDNRIDRFAREQHNRRDWINFAEIAERCAEVSGSIVPDEKARAATYDALRRDLLAGDFEENGRSRVLFLHPRSSTWIRMASEELREVELWYRPRSYSLTVFEILLATARPFRTVVPQAQPAATYRTVSVQEKLRTHR